TVACPSGIAFSSPGVSHPRSHEVHSVYLPGDVPPRCPRGPRSAVHSPLQLFYHESTHHCNHESTHHCNDESTHESVATRLYPNEVRVELHVTGRDGLDGHRHQLVHEHPAAVHVQLLPLRLDDLAALRSADRLVHVREQLRRRRHRAVEQLRVDLVDAGLHVVDRRG